MLLSVRYRTRYATSRRGDCQLEHLLLPCSINARIDGIHVSHGLGRQYDIPVKKLPICAKHELAADLRKPYAA